MAGIHPRSTKDAIDLLLALGTPKLAFMATGYTPAPESESYWSDTSANIASGTTLRTLSNVTVTVNTTDDGVDINFDDPSETPVTASTNKVQLIVDTGTPATSPIICTVNLDQTYSPVGGTLTLTVPTRGLAAINY